MIFRWSRPLGGTLKSATVSRDGKHWYVSFLVETGTTGPAVSVERGRVGIDRGVAVLAATSDGRFFDRSFITPGEAQRYRRLQQRHARMTATARGTSAELGTHIGQKAGLNRAILDKGWHSFELAVRNRARHTGTAVRTVNPAFSSTTCPACGHVHPDNRESQARFVCTACGHREHADTVGAKNVLARGHTGHRAWRPRRQPVCEAPTSAKPQGISAPTSEVGIPAASAAGRIAKSVMWDVTRVSLHET
ncbi:RNA-guided endonuclease InsQ/TnpB family protein [Streptomyces hawaiiensis]|nr:zinc ribbon domain-containing protein [Streptomyces hawaiiensis]